MLRVVNFAHGAMFMLGAFATYYGAQLFHLPFFVALLVAPVVVGLFGVLLETTLLRRLYGLDPIYNLLLTFALVLVIEDLMRLIAGPLGSPYSTPDALSGATNLGFTLYPSYKLFVIVVSLAVCAVAWFVVERTPVGARIRAATENPVLVRALRHRHAAAGDGDLRGRRRARRAGRRAGRADHQRPADDGRRGDHLHLRDRGDRRAGLDRRLDRRRLRARACCRRSARWCSRRSRPR